MDGAYSDMDPRPPPLLMEQQQQEEGVDLDQQFGNMLCRLMDGQLSADEAISELQQHTAAVVQYYRCALLAGLLAVASHPSSCRPLSISATQRCDGSMSEHLSSHSKLADVTLSTE